MTYRSLCSLFFISLLFFLSCSEECLNPEEVQQAVEEGNFEIDVSEDVYNFPPNGRNFLLFDFTGHNCANCPGINRLANTMADASEGHIIVVAAHAPIGGGFTAPLDNPDGSFNTDWRVPEADQYVIGFGATGLPSGSVSGLMNAEGAQAYSKDVFEDVINDVIAQGSLVSMAVTAKFSSATRELQCGASVEALADLDGDLSVAFLLTEDTITDWQKNGTINLPSDPDYSGGDVDNYFHRNILRTSLTGAFGEQWVADGALEGDEMAFSPEIFLLPEEWKEENMKVVTFVIDNSSMEILHVEAVDFEIY